MDRIHPIAHLRTQLRSRPLFEVKGHQIPFVHAGLVGAVGIETTSTKIRLLPSMRCSRLPQPTGTNGTNQPQTYNKQLHASKRLGAEQVKSGRGSKKRAHPRPIWEYVTSICRGTVVNERSLTSP